MAVSFSHLSTPFWPYSTPTPRRPHSAFTFPVMANSYEGGGDVSFCLRFCGLKRWMLKRIKLWQPNTEFELVKQFKTIKNQKSSNDAEAIKESSKAEHRVSKNASAFVDSSPSVPQTHSFDFSAEAGGAPSLCIAVIGATGGLVEIRLQFHNAPGNLYNKLIGRNTDLASNELILCDVPDEAILVKINNKIPGLGLQLDASELNLLYKDKYDVEVPDSYEHLLLDVIDGDNHLFMRSDELAAAWSILTPVLEEIGKKHMTPELYEMGGRGLVGAYYLWAKHGVRWVED